MIKRIIAMAIAAMLLISCAGEKSSLPAESEASSAPAESSEDSEEVSYSWKDREVVVEGKINFQQLPDALFTMDYEPRTDSVTRQHLGMNFNDVVDTDWLGDSGLDALYDLHEGQQKVVYGSVKITTAPENPAKYYAISDEDELKSKMSSELFTAENYYNGYRKNISDDFGYEIVREGYGEAFEGWNAFYVEFVDKENQKRGLRFYLCNDEINEKFYSLWAQVDLDAADEDRADMYRSIIFTLHKRDD